MVKKEMFLVMSLCLMTRTCQCRPAQLPEPVGWWLLDEGSGTTVTDNSGNGYDGTLEGDVTFVAGKHGGAVSFNENTAYVSIPPDAWNDEITDDSFSFCIWAKISAAARANDTTLVRVGGDGDSRVERFFQSHFPWNNGNIYWDRDGAGRENLASAWQTEWDDEWTHAAFVYESGGVRQLFVNGETILDSTDSGALSLTAEGFWIGNGHDNSGVLNHAAVGSLIDDVRLYNDVLTVADIAGIMAGEDLVFGPAVNPNPGDGETDVIRDASLTWGPGKFPNGHEVYFGTSFEDVNAATTASDAYKGPKALDDTSFDPGRMEFGKTYFWRIDEVNDAHPDKLWKGDVWSFTTEPFAYPIENITATASSSAPDQGPENTVNGSGLDDSGLLHGSNSAGTMWESSLTGDQPSWIAYEFDRLYKLHDMWVWNYNASWEQTIGVGVKDATIEYSVDGSDYTTLGTTHEFAQGPGTADYAHNTTVDFEGVTAKHVRLTANSNWGGGILNQYGLCEIRLSYVPVVAREPSPISGATDVDVDVILDWRAGREAASHDVYVGADPNALILAGSVTGPGFDTASLALALGQSYYWRVDEVNDAETPKTWQSEAWSFTTRDYLVVDDFESYNDIEAGQEGSNLIYLTWSDGFDNPTANGSTIGYTVAFQPSMETEIVHGGSQSVPLVYDNSVASLSEVTVNTNDLAIGRDWTKGAAETLVLWFYGDPANAVTERMYVKVNGVKVPYPGAAEDITKPIWQQWNIDLAALGISLSNVSQLIIGFERTGASSGSGTVLIDDILLYRSAPSVASEVIWLEAESAAITAPMNVNDDPAASGGKYVSTENLGVTGAHLDGVAKYSFTVKGGTYKIQGRVIEPAGGASNSFWVRLPGATMNTTPLAANDGWTNWNFAVGTTWHWDEVINTDDGNIPIRYTLAPGTYTLEIAYREDGAQLDAIMITDASN